MNTQLEDFKSTLNPNEPTIDTKLTEITAMYNDLRLANPIILHLNQIFSTRRKFSNFIFDGSTSGYIWKFHNTPFNVLQYFPDVTQMFTHFTYNIRFTIFIRSNMQQQGQLCLLHGLEYIHEIPSQRVYDMGYFKGARNPTPSYVPGDVELASYPHEYFDLGNNIDITVDFPNFSPCKFFPLKPDIFSGDDTYTNLHYHSMGFAGLKISIPLEVAPNGINQVSGEVFMELQNVEFFGWLGGKSMTESTL